jgi:hypothetical protein
LLCAQRDADVWAWLPIRRISDEEIAEREASFAARVVRATGAPGSERRDGEAGTKGSR